LFSFSSTLWDLETAKKFYSEALGCRLDNSAQEWADVDFWGNELTLHASEHKLDNERHDVDMGNVQSHTLVCTYQEKILMLLSKD
jgi:extradiol dioxygenase family protein